MNHDVGCLFEAGTGRVKKSQMVTKEILLEKLHKEKIILKGAGHTAYDFYKRNQTRLKITGYTARDAGAEWHGLQRLELKEIIEAGNCFIIVCIADSDEAVCELLSKGLRMGEDFVCYQIAEALLDDKKIFLEVGQCELAVTDYIFKSMPSFTEKYLPLYYDEYKVLGIADRKPLLQTVIEVEFVIVLADYYIYPVNLTQRCKYYENLKKKVKDHCITASVTLATFEGYWPEDNRKDYYEKCPYYLTEASSRMRRDCNLENAVKENQSDIIERISNEDFYEEEFVRRHLEKSLRKFEILDRKADIGIGDYYRKNYAVKKIFLDRGHTSAEVLREYAKRILNFCDIQTEAGEVESIDLAWYDKSHNECPIYPSVLKTLEFETERYRLITGEEERFLEFDAYKEIMRKTISYGYRLEGILNEENHLYCE